jgi:hypothetical protein
MLHILNSKWLKSDGNKFTYFTSWNSLKDAKVTLIDVLGRNLTNTVDLQKMNNDKITLNISSLSAGTYFVVIEDETRRSVKQIVKY